MKRKTKKKIYALTRLTLTLIFIALIIYLIVLGINTFTKNKEDKNEEKEPVKQQEETKKEEQEIVEEKYTKKEKEKLEKLNYVNEKVTYFKWENVDRYIAYKEKNKNLSNEKIVLYVNIGIDNDFYTNTVSTPDPHSTKVLVNKYYKVESNYVPKNLKYVDSKYSSSSVQMTEEAANAFNELAKDAKKEGYTILAMSTYRSYSRQKTIYNNYLNSENGDVAKVDTYSARAGHSEHHTGLAVDVKNDTKAYTKFGETKEFEWMKENAHKYGYILRYTAENQFITGYKNEPWHYRYVGIEIATQMKKENISSYEEYYFMYLDK